MTLTGSKSENADTTPPARGTTTLLEQHSRWSEWLSVGVLLLLTAGFYWKLAFTNQYTWLNHWDMCGLQIPRLEFQAREIHAGRFPLWDPHIWAGQPLVGQTQPGPLYPLNLLFCLLPLGNGYLRLDFLNWYYITIHFQAALLLYWLCRDLGRSRAASIAAGCAFSFGGFIGTAPWLDLMNGAVWTPLVFLFLLRALRGYKPAASTGLFGLFLGLTWLSGHHEIPLLTSLATLAIWLYAVLRDSVRHRREAWRLACLLVLGFTIATMVSAVQVIPTYEFGKLSKRWIGAGDPIGWNDRIPYSVHARYSLSARGLLGFILPNQDEQAGSTPFLGVVAVTLAALGLVAGRREREVRYMTAITGIAAMYALGGLTPLHRFLYEVVPLLEKARAPVRAIYLCNFAMAVLAAYGLDRLLARRASYWLLLFLMALSLVELTGVSGERIQSLHDKGKLNLVGLLFQDQDVVNYLRSQPGPLRIAVTGEDILIDFADWHGVDVLQGSGAGVTENVQQHELDTERTQRIFAVTHFVGKGPGPPNWQQVFVGQSGMKVFRNPVPLPRARAVHEAIQVSGAGALRLLIQDPGFDPSRTAAILGPVPSLEQCNSPDQVSFVHRETDRVTLRARMGCRGLLILADTFFVGWEALVDGRPASIHEVYGAVRGVVVDSGDHRVEMRYRPNSVYAGGVLTFVGLLVAAALQLTRLSAIGNVASLAS